MFGEGEWALKINHLQEGDEKKKYEAKYVWSFNKNYMI